MKNIDWKWVSIVILIVGFVAQNIIHQNNNYNLEMKKSEICRDTVVN